MRLYRTEAIALQDRPGQEADRLVWLFTARYGLALVRVAGLARSKSRYGSAMELLSHTDVLLHKRTEGQGTYRLTQCTIVRSHDALRADLSGIAIASMVAEAVNAFVLRDEPQPLVWALLLRTLEALESGADRNAVLISYLCHLMRLTGYWPRWEECVDTQAPPGEGAVAYWPREGGVVEARSVASGQDLPTLRHATWRAVAELSRSKLLALPQVDLDALAMREIWAAFDAHWRTHVEWESKALRFLRSLDAG